MLGLLAAGGCKKAPEPEAAAPAPKAAAVSVDGAGDAPPPPAASVEATPAEAGATTAAAGEASATLGQDEPQATQEEVAKFNPKEPMNAYAPRQPGDYQAQLDMYNRVLRTWARNADRPATFKDLMATYNSPKPPEPPAGRKLVYDARTLTVRLE